MSFSLKKSTTTMLIKHPTNCFFDEIIMPESFEFAGEVINVSVAPGVGIYRHRMAFADVAKKADSEMYIHKSASKAKYGEEVR